VAVLAAQSLWLVIPMGLIMALVAAAGTGLTLAGAASDEVLTVTGLLLLLSGAADVASRYRVRRDQSANTGESPPNDGGPLSRASGESVGEAATLTVEEQV
jgi:ABC-type uncharacterized transport system permease subunit